MSRAKLLLNEILFYLIVQFFGLFSAWKVLKIPGIQEQIEKQKVSWLDLIISIIFGAIIILLVLKFLKQKTPYKIFFGLLFFLGTFYTLNIWLPLIFSLILTVIIFWLHQRWSRIITHNLIITLTITWASVLLGLVISPWQMVIILLILSAYDMIAVWKTKHMIRMFKGLAEKGVIFALIIPTKVKNLFQPIPLLSEFHSDVRINADKMQTWTDAGNSKRRLTQTEAQTEAEGILPELAYDQRESAIHAGEKSAYSRDFIFLGTGDLALPMVFAVSALRQNIWVSILIIAGALLGIVFINLVMMGKERKPLPALPPLAAGAILGWLIAKLFYNI